MTRNTTLRGPSALRSAGKPAHLSRRGKATMARSFRRGISKLCAIVLGAAVMLGGAVVTSAAVADESNAAASKPTAASADASNRDVTVVAFQQSWNTIAKECTTTYGPEGVGYVQISPPEESVQGTQWWTVYQPISYSLNSRFGTESELKSMIETCNAAGVQIIADVVLNHTSGHDVSWVDDQFGVAGTAYNGTYGRYPGIGIYQYEESGNNHQYGLASGDFHSCRTNIADYTNIDEVQECRLSTMWDINTGSSRVQTIQADYLARLWNLGVRGFRIDSAKHINASDLKAIKAKLAAKIGVAASDIPFQQEVIYHQGESDLLAPKRYTANGDVTEFSYAYQLRQYFNGDISNLKGIDDGLLPSDKATVFVSNWDTARGSETLTVDSGSKYELATAFMLAYDYGSPKIMSDYYYTADNSDAGPNGTTDTSVADVDFDAVCKTSGTRVQGQWLCEQRWTSVRGMIGFRNAVAGTTVGNWQDVSTNNIGFARQNSAGKDVGFVAINNTLQEHKNTYATSLPDGTYCDVYSSSGKTCTPVTVKDGKFSVTLGKRSAVAIYQGMTPQTWGEGYEGADSGYDDEADTDRIGDDSATIYYKPSADWGDDVYIQYASGDNLLNGTPVRMAKAADVSQSGAGSGPGGIDTSCAAADGWYVITLDKVTAHRLRYRFTNDATGGEAALWDYRDGYSTDGGGKPYENAVGTAITAVQNHDETIGVPFACETSVQTRFTVHFKAVSDAQNAATGVVVWGADSSGAVLQATYHPFDSVMDSDGKRMTMSLPGDFTAVSYRIVGSADAAAPAVDGTNAMYSAAVIDRTSGSVTAKVRGSIESWVDGGDGANGAAYDSSSESRHPSSVPQPNDVKNPKRLNVIVHYMRADGNYQEYDLDTDSWKGWDLWTWSNEQTGSPVQFTEHDDYGMIARYTLNQETKGNRNPEFILRQGGDSWSGKDPDGNDRLIPESAIQVEAGQTDEGVAEIWLVSGDPTIYTYRPPVVGVTFKTRTDWYVSPQAVMVGGTVRELGSNENPKRDGYIFKGWTTDEAGANDFVLGEGGTPVTGRLKLWAKYEKANLIAFDTGIDWKVDAQTVEIGGYVQPIADSQVPQREGYDFLGWSRTDGSEVADYALGDGPDGVPVTESFTLHAVWRVKRFTVTFDTGAEGSPVAPQTVEYGGAVSKPVSPTRAGYTFVGWVTDADSVTGEPGNTPYVFGTAVTGDLTLYAKWAVEGTTMHVVTFHRNDGSGNADGDTTSYVEHGTTLTAPAITRDGYRLRGWSTSADGTGELFDFASTPITDDVSLYAQWVKTWTVSFDLNYAGAPSGSEPGAVPAQTVDDGGYAAAPTPAPTRDGYEFDGWYVDADLTEPFVFAESAKSGSADVSGGSATGEHGATAERDIAGGVGTPTPVTTDTTLYAKWVKAGRKWTITFDLNGGELSDNAGKALDPKQVADGEYLTKPKVNPVRSGYTFQGWTTVRNDALAFVGGTSFSGGSAFGFDENGRSLIPIDRNGTLYALWAKSRDQ